jgi:hypothetical protein
MADATGTYDIGNWVQAGLSTGESVVMPYAAAVWRRAIAVPFNVQNPLDPFPVECQLWPRFSSPEGGG